MIALFEPLAANFGTGDMLMGMVLEDLTDEQARTRTREGAGPSVAWEVLHMLAMRHVILGLLGNDGENPFQQYIQEAATDGADYPTLVELRQHWAESQKALMEALGGATDEAARKEIPFFGGEAKPVYQSVAFLSFHEGYHIGALGAIRKEIGMPGPAELMMARMAKAKEAEAN